MFYIVSKSGRNGFGFLSAIYKSEPVFGISLINAYESENDEIVVDAAVYSNMDILKQHVKMSNLNSSSPEAMPLSTIRRFVLPKIKVESARFEGAAGLIDIYPIAHYVTLFDTHFELPLVHPKYENNLTLEMKDDSIHLLSD